MKRARSSQLAYTPEFSRALKPVSIYLRRAARRLFARFDPTDVELALMNEASFQCCRLRLERPARMAGRTKKGGGR